jgi:hypothetical protein
VSNTINDIIRERAKEAAEQATNSMLGAQLDKAIAADDLDLMRELTHNVEAHELYIETVNDSEVY